MAGKSYKQPHKAILTSEQLTYFQQQSETHKAILAFVGQLNNSVVGVKLTADCAVSNVCALI
jgi:serine/threonine-protein phosphatase 2A activator